MSLFIRVLKKIIPKTFREKIYSLRSNFKRNNYIYRNKSRIFFEKVFGINLYPYKNYSDKYNCIFIHIPKNAGTSVILVLNDLNKEEQEHNTYWDYLRSDPFRFKYYYKFCIVRNPWDRLYSAYCYLSNGGNRDNDIPMSSRINKECKDFTDFVLNWLDTEKIYNIKVLNPQYIYIYDFYTNLVVVDNILKFENLSNDFSIIVDKLNIKNNLPWTNKSNNSDFRKVYSKEMIDKVSILYSRDIDLLKYKFED